MEKKRIEKLEEALNFLKERLSSNVTKVKNNSILSQNMVLQNPFTEDIDHIKTQNRLILNENKEILNLQLSIQKYILKYESYLLQFQEEKQIDSRSIEEWFELTVNEIIELNEKHPFINDVIFLNDLLSYYQNKEEYEKCQTVIDIMNKL